jgi:hypothetical protein
MCVLFVHNIINRGTFIFHKKIEMPHWGLIFEWLIP